MTTQMPEAAREARPADQRLFRVLGRGWIVFAAAVIGNALLQALTTSPFVAPEPTAALVGRVAISALAILVAAGAVFAQLRATVDGVALRPPRAVDGWVLILGAAAIVAATVVWMPLLIVTTTLCLMILAPRPEGVGWTRRFRSHPGRAIGLTLVTIVLLVVLMLGALLSGFLITGAVSAAITWIAIGTVVVVLAAAWTRLAG